MLCPLPHPLPRPWPWPWCRDRLCTEVFLTLPGLVLQPRSSACHALLYTCESGNPSEKLVMGKNGCLGRDRKDRVGVEARWGGIKSNLGLCKNFLQKKEPFNKWFPEWHPGLTSWRNRLGDQQWIKSSSQAGICISLPSFSHFTFIFKASIPKTHKTTVTTSNDFLQPPWKALEKCFPLIGYLGKTKINNLYADILQMWIYIVQILLVTIHLLWKMAT